MDHPTAYSRPFLDFHQVLQADQVFFYTDSSRNTELGFGGICNNSWMYGKWPAGFIATCDPSIAYLELYAVTVALVLWIKKFNNRRIVLFCDNISVVYMLNKMVSGCRNCMVLLRLITLHSMIHNMRVFARYVSTADNDLADSLSRLKVSKFKQLAADRGIPIDDIPNELPNELTPVTKLWLY